MALEQNFSEDSTKEEQMQYFYDSRHFGAGQNRPRSKSAQKTNEPTLLYSALIKKKFVCKVNSFAFNGNLLHWEHDCIFALPLRLFVNHYYKQVIVFT